MKAPGCRQGGDLQGPLAPPSLAGLLRQALDAHELERAELIRLRKEVAWFRAHAATMKTGNADEMHGVGPGALLLQESSLELHPPPCDPQDSDTSHASEEQQPQPQQQMSKRSNTSSCSPTGKLARKSTFDSIHQERDSCSKTSMGKKVAQSVERISIALIVTNIVMLWVQLQYEGHLIGVGLGLARDDVWPSLHNTFSVLEHGFNIAFLLEFAVRLAAWRSEFFYKDGEIEKFNMFDMLLVLSTSFDLYVMRPLLRSSGMNLTIFRPLRFVRLIRTLRVLGTLKFFMTLRVMLNAIAASINALFWSMTLVLVVMLMAALFLCQSVNDSLSDSHEIKAESLEWMFMLYGTPFRASWTVFELTFSGGWPAYVTTLVEEVSIWYALFFLAYIVLVTFALFRIITALFLQDTMALAAKDAEVAIQQKLAQKEKFANKMFDFFQAADTSGDGYLTKEEFHEILSNEKVKTWFHMLEISLNETDELFGILADADGLVSFEEFKEGLVKMKGAARSEDVMAIKHTCLNLSKDVKSLNHILSSVIPQVQELRGDVQVRRLSVTKIDDEVHSV